MTKTKLAEREFKAPERQAATRAPREREANAAEAVAVIRLSAGPDRFNAAPSARASLAEKTDSLRALAALHPLKRALADPRIINRLATRESFDKLSDQAEDAGSAGMPEVKFLIDRKKRKTYFVPKEFKFHYDFARDVLGIAQSSDTFDTQNYGHEDRAFIPGTMTAYDNFEANGIKGTYGMTFWSGDPVRAPLVKEAFARIAAAMPFAKDKLIYHPDSQLQEGLLDIDSGSDRAALSAARIPIFSNADLAKNFTFSALNAGVSFGTLAVVHGDGTGQPLTRGTIAIYADNVPPTLPPLAGVLTAAPQTYLSHDALKARQDHTPYVYARDVLSDPAVQALTGKVVKLEVTPTGYKLSAATEVEAASYLESMRPTQAQTLKPDLAVTQVRRLDQIRFADQHAFGTKTTNVAELHQLALSGVLNAGRLPGEPEVIAPDGSGIPQSVSNDFMHTAMFDATTTFDEQLTKMLANPQFKTDVTYRQAQLAAFQAAILAATVPAAIQAKLDALKTEFASRFLGQDMRVRSSSDSEDLQGFNGAGLFDSYTFHFAKQDKPGKTLADIFKKSVASLWNSRAFDEFDFYRIDPHSVAMGQLVMPNSEDEIANGVVRWGGGIGGGWDSMTVNAQVGENLVTNPTGGATPDNILVANYGLQGQTVVQYLTKTNQPLVGGRTHALTDPEVAALFRAMKVVEGHFKTLYGTRDGFNIECEFKITKDGKLLIKQARPWVE